MTRSALFAFVLLQGGAGASVAATQDLEGALHECKQIADSNLRLKCFDNLAQQAIAPADRAEQVAEPEGLEDQSGSWVVEEKINPLDDTPTVIASLAAIEGQGLMPGPITLYLRCESKKTESYILWRQFLGLSATVQTRFDQGEPTSREWVLSTDRQATFFPGSGLQFVVRVASASRLAAQVTPSAGQRTTAVFDLTGAKAVADRLRNACSW